MSKSAPHLKDLMNEAASCPEPCNGCWKRITARSEEFRSLPVRSVAGEEERRWSGGEVEAGSVTLGGIPHRIFQLGVYYRVEDIDIRGVRAEQIQGLVSTAEAGRFSPNRTQNCAWTRTSITPPLPRVGLKDVLVMALACTGAHHCQLSVGLPSGRLRARGPGADLAAARAFQWMQCPQQTSSRLAHFPFEDEYADFFGPEEASRSLISYLDATAGDLGREVRGDSSLPWPFDVQQRFRPDARGQ